MGASPQGGKRAGRKASMSALAKRAVIDSFAKLTPREQAKNPVMLMVYISAILTLGLFALSLFGIADAHPAFIFCPASLPQTDAKPSRQALDKTKDQVNNNAGRPHGRQCVRSHRFSHDHGIRQRIKQLKEISCDHRQGELQQNLKRLSFCKILCHNVTKPPLFPFK